MYPTTAQNTGANKWNFVPTRFSRWHIQTPIRIKDNTLLLLDIKYEHRKGMVLGWISVDNSDDEIVAVTDNRVL